MVLDSVRFRIAAQSADSIRLGGIAMSDRFKGWVMAIGFSVAAYSVIVGIGALIAYGIGVFG